MKACLCDLQSDLLRFAPHSSIRKRFHCSSVMPSHVPLTLFGNLRNTRITNKCEKYPFGPYVSQHSGIHSRRVTRISSGRHVLMAIVLSCALSVTPFRAFCLAAAHPPGPSTHRLTQLTTAIFSLPACLALPCINAMALVCRVRPPLAAVCRDRCFTATIHTSVFRYRW